LASDRGPRSGLLIASGAGLGLALFGVNWFNAAFACEETSYCALGGPLRKWQGRVFTDDGRPAERPVLRFGFESMRTKGATTPIPRISIRGDQHGRYCFRWPVERIKAIVSAEEAQSAAEPDPRFDTATPKDFVGDAQTGPILVSPDVTSERIGSLPATGIRLSGALWRPSADAVADCPKPAAQPPWHRIDDLRENWRYQLLKYLSLGVAGIALAGLLVPRRRQRQVAIVALALGGVDAVLLVLIWAAKTI